MEDCRDFHDWNDAGILLGGDLTWVVIGRYCYVSFGYEWLNCAVQVQSVTWVGMLISPSAPVSSTGTGFGPLPSREGDMWLVLSCFTRATLPPLWIADQVRNDGLGVYGFHPHLQGRGG